MLVKDLAWKWTRGTAKAAAQVVHHPLGSAAMAAGVVKGTAEASAGLVRDLVRRTPQVDVPVQRGETPADATTTPTARSTAGDGAGPREPQVVPKPVLSADELPEPVVIEADDHAEQGEAFHNEPRAASREAEHGEGPGDREELAEELEDALVESDDTPVWTTETPTSADDGHESLLDEATLKAVRSETEMLRKAAEQRAR